MPSDLPDAFGQAQTLLERLQRQPQAFGHAAPSVERLQTHISWLLLVGEHVYKFKKPLKLEFLDFSTAALRRAATTRFLGHLAWDDAISGPRPAVMVSHAWAGCGDHERGRARKLAELGYVGFAIDMYGEGKQGDGVEECAALMQPLVDSRETLQQRILLALATLRQQPEVDAARVAAMGFCFGGLCVLDLARTGADVRGVASFHGLFTPPGNTEGNRITASVLVLHGYDDPMVPPQSIVDLGSELTAAGADWQIHAYGGTVHAFTLPGANDPGFGAVYSEKADRRSWQSLVNFLAEIFA